MKYVLFLFFISFISGVILIAGLMFVGRAIRVAMLPVRAVDRTIGTAEGVIDKTLNANNAIYNYEFFRQQKEDIKAIESKIEIAQTSYDAFIASAGPRKDWTFEDKTESARLASIKQGLQSQYQDMVATYNARSKMANRNIFLDGKLPNALQAGSNFLR